MALMSDTDTYLSAAKLVGVNYIRATGTELQCRELHDAQRQDEFTRREALDRAATLLQDVIAQLPDQPRRVEVPIKATYGLDEYDFNLQGFPIEIAKLQGAPILSPGIVPLLTEERPIFCRTSWGHSGDFGAASRAIDDFDRLGAEHGGVPGVDFLPMPQVDARLFRSGGNSVEIRATLVVEPREQGLGPLRGQIAALSAHDPADGRLLHRWDVAASPSGDPEQAPGSAWSPDLLASLTLPVLEPDIDDAELDSAAVQYFRRYEASIAKGNPPPQSPLPVEEMRGRVAEVIVATNRDRLREVLREPGPNLPLTVERPSAQPPISRREKAPISIRTKPALLRAKGRIRWKAWCYRTATSNFMTNSCPFQIKAVTWKPDFVLRCSLRNVAACSSSLTASCGSIRWTCPLRKPPHAGLSAILAPGGATTSFFAGA